MTDREDVMRGFGRAAADGYLPPDMTEVALDAIDATFRGQLCDLCGRPRDVERVKLNLRPGYAGWIYAHRGCQDQWENDRAEVALD